ncbi:MAG: peptidoglycan editing factor PgeF [Caulobacteraceae bacterium]
MSDLPALTSPLLSALPGVRHAFFTRHGGVSTGIYDSLNVGLGSKDDPTAVVENRRRAAAHFGASAEALSTCYQIHSATTVVATAPWGDVRQEGDGVVTQTSGVVCGALSADCAPILLADAQAGVVAAVHAGWRGALGGVAASAVASMVGLGAQPGRIVAVVGPCIGPNSYEVGLDFLETFTAQAPGSQRFFSAGAKADKRMFDLPAFVLDRLALAGVETAEWIGADTCADEDFFSNRRAFQRGEGDYGRLLSAITLE